jgi:hypothetical protein
VRIGVASWKASTIATTGPRDPIKAASPTHTAVLSMPATVSDAVPDAIAPADGAGRVPASAVAATAVKAATPAMIGRITVGRK